MTKVFYGGINTISTMGYHPEARGEGGIVSSKEGSKTNYSEAAGRISNLPYWHLLEPSSQLVLVSQQAIPVFVNPAKISDMRYIRDAIV